MARHQLRRARRRRQRDRPRPDRPRARARRQGLDPQPHPARVDLRELRRSSPPAPSRSRSTRPTPPEECHYVLDHSESRAVFVEDAEQLAKVREVQGDLPNLEHIVIFDPAGDVGDAISLDELRERGAAATTPSSRSASRRRHQRRHLHHIYTSGTTGPPKGCLLTPRQLPRRHVDDRVDGRARGGRGRLPLPAARARVRAADPVRDASTSAARSPTGRRTRRRSSPT